MSDTEQTEPFAATPVDAKCVGGVAEPARLDRRALSEVLPALERAGLLVADIEILRLHHAETLKAWRQRFVVHREEVERIYDRRSLHSWRRAAAPTSP